MANAATCSVWKKTNPIDMPAAAQDSYWLSDGGYTNGPAAANAIARYQKQHGTDGDREVKLIISNHN